MSTTAIGATLLTPAVIVVAVWLWNCCSRIAAGVGLIGAFEGMHFE